MLERTYKAYLVREHPTGAFTRSIENLPLDRLGTEGVLVKVSYAALNYKDALSASGHKGITKQFPHTPGVDASGIVEEDTSGSLKKGEKVLVTGYDLGMNTNGGFGEYIRVPSEWLVPLPEGIDLYQAMIMGTGAFTAGLALYKMELNGQKPSMGPLLITGASGGVGSMAIAICAKAGYELIASSGKREAYDYLHMLGAKKIVSREEVDISSDRPLLRSFFAGAIDTVGGNTLTTLLKCCGAKGMVASTGLVSSPFFEANVYPFIIKGVSLLGIDSAETEKSLRLQIWNKLSNEWKPDHLDKIGKLIRLEELEEQVQLILKGQTKGRIVVEHAK